MIQQTRFKTVLLGLGLGIVEGLLSAFMPGFPVIEVFSFQGAIVGAYLAAKTSGNNKRVAGGRNEKTA